MSDLPSGDGSLTTPLSELLSPIICRLEVMSNGEIEDEVLLACSEAGVSEFKISELKCILDKLRKDRKQLQIFIVNLTLAAKGLKAFPFRTRRRNR